MGFVFFKSSPEDMLIDSREEEGRETGRERNIHHSPLSCTQTET